MWWYCINTSNTQRIFTKSFLVTIIGLELYATILWPAQGYSLSGYITFACHFGCHINNLSLCVVGRFWSGKWTERHLAIFSHKLFFLETVSAIHTVHWPIYFVPPKFSYSFLPSRWDFRQYWINQHHMITCELHYRPN